MFIICSHNNLEIVFLFKWSIFIYLNYTQTLHVCIIRSVSWLMAYIQFCGWWTWWGGAFGALQLGRVWGQSSIDGHIEFVFTYCTKLFSVSSYPYPALVGANTSSLYISFHSFMAALSTTATGQ